MHAGEEPWVPSFAHLQGRTQFPQPYIILTSSQVSCHEQTDSLTCPCSNIPCNTPHMLAHPIFPHTPPQLSYPCTLIHMHTCSNTHHSHLQPSSPTCMLFDSAFTLTESHSHCHAGTLSHHIHTQQSHTGSSRHSSRDREQCSWPHLAFSAIQKSWPPTPKWLLSICPGLRTEELWEAFRLGQFGQ